MLASGKPLIAENSAAAHLHAETLDRDIWDSDRDEVLKGIRDPRRCASAARGLLPLLRPTLVQTIFYGIFSAWVQWARDQPPRSSACGRLVAPCANGSEPCLNRWQRRHAWGRSAWSDA